MRCRISRLRLSRCGRCGAGGVSQGAARWTAMNGGMRAEPTADCVRGWMAGCGAGELDIRVGDDASCSADGGGGGRGCGADVQVLHLSHGFWLAMTSIIVLQPYGSGTLRRRVLSEWAGRLPAAVLAALLAAAIHTEAGVIAVITVTSVLTLATYAVDYGWYCFFLTPTFVLMSLPHLQDWHFAGLRMGTTVVGAVVAVIAMRLLWPEREEIELGNCWGAGRRRMQLMCGRCCGSGRRVRRRGRRRSGRCWLRRGAGAGCRSTMRGDAGSADAGAKGWPGEPDGRRR